jgi:RHS repeat-associated protein
MKARILLSAVLAVLSWTPPSLAAVRAGVTSYRVQLVLYPGDDGAAVAKRLAAMYRGTVETAVDSDGSFTLALSPATADLMARDPAVEHLERAETTPAPALETTAMATPWKLGDYQYDGSGNIRRIGTDFYAYDNRNRLVLSADATQSTLVPKQSYTYDNFGNMRSVTTAGTGMTTMGINTSSNRVTAATAAGASTATGYDQAGNMTQYGTATYTYDALNMLTRSTFDNATRYYIYSASDERIGTIEVSAAGTRSDWTIRDAAGQVLRRFSKESTGEWKWQEDYIYRGSQMLAAEVPDSTKTRHFHLDHLGTPRLITGNGGVELSRHSYHPFGVEIASASTSSTATARETKQFTGHERDAESLDYMHARFYAPYMGRFLSVDPVIDFKTSLRNPQGWNRYSYVRDNPTRWTDPTGKLIEYGDEFRNRLKNDKVFREAFEAWKQTKSGAAQWKVMAFDKDTKYTFNVARVVYQPSLLSDKFQANGMTVPPSYAAREDKNGQLNNPWTKMTINVDRMEEAGTPQQQARTIAGALFEEAAHALDLGSSSRTEWGANRAEEGFHADPPTEPRWIRYMRELLAVLPEEQP